MRRGRRGRGRKKNGGRGQWQERKCDLALAGEMTKIFNLRQHEHRDCPQYDHCLNEAARANARCVPCKGCRLYGLLSQSLTGPLDRPEELHANCC